ncbi:MAG: hypothetical protein WCJ25_05340, partial [Candidatus Moraniibacteriota bacterium]
PFHFQILGAEPRGILRMKNKLVNEKQLLKEKLSAFEQKANNRFELTEKFLKYNIELANEGINEEKLHLFKKVGSNFLIKARTVLFEPRGAWRTLSDSGFFGGNTFVSALRADPISASDSDFQFWRRGRDSNPRHKKSTWYFFCFRYSVGGIKRAIRGQNENRG